MASNGSTNSSSRWGPPPSQQQQQTPQSVPSSSLDALGRPCSPATRARLTLEDHRQQLATLGGEDPEFVLMDTIEWGPDTNTESDELAPRPKPENGGDPCFCRFNYDDPNAVTCNDLSCVLFACQEECRSNCTVGDQCGNKRIQRREWKKLQLIDAGPKGKGLVVQEDCKKGDLVVEYVGRAVNRAYLPHLFRRYRNERKLYIMSLTADVFLDARRSGGIARYINHSCDPNCKVERWKVRGLLRAAVIAMKDIPAGTELSFDYQWERKRGRAPTKCYCGSENCRGTLEVPRSLEEEALDRQLSQHWKRPLIKRAGREIVNRCVKLYSKEAQDYYTADVTQYDESKGLHLLMFRHDLEESWEDLKSEDWMILDEEAEQFFIQKKTQTAEPTTSSSSSLLTGLGNGMANSGGIHMQGQMSHANYVYAHTSIKEQLFQMHLIERCQRSCEVTIEPTKFTMPHDAATMDTSVNPELAERLRMLQSSKDGVVWKLTIAGADVAKARDVLSRNIVYLTNKEMGNSASNQNLNGAPRGAQNGTGTTMTIKEETKEQDVSKLEVIMPREIVSSLKTRLPAIRDSCKSVKFDFVSSDSKSKQIAKLVILGTDEDIQVSRDLLWQQLNQCCEENNSAKTSSGVYKDLGFFAGTISSSDFIMLSGYGKGSALAASTFALSPNAIIDMATTNEQGMDMVQDAREDLSSMSPFFSSFESAQRCAVWVQTDSDKGRIDGSNRLVNEAKPDEPRSVYIGCAPSRVQDLWKLVVSRLADVGNGVRYLFLGADRIYQPQLMQNGSEFFGLVNRATGARVEIDSVTGDHLRIDGTLIGAADMAANISPGERATKAEELVRLQIELYRDNNVNREQWLFGRDWALARRVALANGAAESAQSDGHASFGSASGRTIGRQNPFEGKQLINACLDIADIVKKLDLDKGVAAHASTLLYRFGTIMSMRHAPVTQLKIKEVLVACVFLANKAQKKTKWKRLVSVLEAAYATFYPSRPEFDSSKEESLVWEEKVMQAEVEIIERLDYDVFYRGFDWILSTATEILSASMQIQSSSTDGAEKAYRKAKEFLSFALSQPVLASGADLWLSYGPEYIFVASAAFLDVESLDVLCLSLSLVPIKVCRAAEIIASAVRTTTFGQKLSHPIFKSGRKVLENMIPTIKIKCANLMSENDGTKRLKTKLSERQVMYMVLAERNMVGRRYRMAGDLIRRHLLPSIDSVMAESNCRIYIDRAEKDSRLQTDIYDVTLEGTWRGVSIASQTLARTVGSGGNAPFVRQPYEKKEQDKVLQFRNMEAKGRPGMVPMKKIEMTDGWTNTVHSSIFDNAGWGRKTGGKCCIPGRVKESELRLGGLRWWIPPRYGPSSTGSICDMLLPNGREEDLAGTIGRLAYLSQGTSSSFSMLTSDTSSDAGSERPTDRYVAISLNPWPPEKTASYEQGKAKRADDRKKGKKKKVSEVGFSPSALEEMQLLRQLHSLVKSPQGHPNFYLPISVGSQPFEKKPDTNSNSDDTRGLFDMKSIDEDIFSLTRKSLQGEGITQKELRGKTPHLVTPPVPFVLQRFVGKKKRLADDDQMVVSPKIFACWCHDLLSALLHCHTNDVVLRYFQMDQIVLDHSGVAKIGSLCRANVLSKEDKSAKMLDQARKRKDKMEDDDDIKDPYIPPEMLMGSPLHTKEGDIWALGSLFAHLLIGKPICSAKDRESFLTSLYKLVGAPSSKHFPLAKKFPYFVKPLKKYQPDVHKAIRRMAKDRADMEDYSDAIDLISQMLQLDPSHRITAEEALKHGYMLNFVEDSKSESFQDEFISEWVALKSKLMDSNKTEDDEIDQKERGEKRKAMLAVAAETMAGEDDDLYDMGDLLGSEAKRQKN